MAHHRVKCFEGSSYQEATNLYERWLYTIGSEPTVTLLSVRYDKDHMLDGETNGKYYVLVRYKQEGPIEYTVKEKPEPRTRGVRLKMDTVEENFGELD